MKRRAELEATPAEPSPFDRELADAMVRGRCAHLTHVELRLAAKFVGMTPAMVDGPPEGVIVGESPGPNTAGRRPLMPWPAGASGERLMKFADMTPGQYLGRFVRFNLFPFHVPADEWNVERAQRSAVTLRDSLVAEGTWRIVLLGARVAKAFGIDSPWTRVEEFHANATGGTVITLVALPHPSGLNHDYNNERVRYAAGAAVRWAAGYL